jgi:K(+)-stimulated pyrophosphate-energized sodium pump
MQLAVIAIIIAYFSGAIIGAVLPFLFASLTMNAVSKGATIVVNEVRRQFAEYPGIMDHSQKPNYFRCVVLITAQSIQSMLIPGLLTIGLPLAAGLAFPLQFLAAFLMGIIITGFLLASMKASAGGAWDNAKVSNLLYNNLKLSEIY